MGYGILHHFHSAVGLGATGERTGTVAAAAAGAMPAHIHQAQPAVQPTQGKTRVSAVKVRHGQPSNPGFEDIIPRVCRQWQRVLCGCHRSQWPADLAEEALALGGTNNALRAHSASVPVEKRFRLCPRAMQGASALWRTINMRIFCIFFRLQLTFRRVCL